MSDTIPIPSDDPVDLEVLRAFHDEYIQLQRVEEKKVILRMKDVLMGYAEQVRSAGKEIGMDRRFVLPLDDQLVVRIEWAAHDIWLDGQSMLERVVADPPELSDKAMQALRNRLAARYSVFRLNQVAPELGVEFEDLIFGGKFAVLDLPMAENRKPGDLIATRIYWTGDYWTHSSGRFFPREQLVPAIRRRVKDIAGEARYEDLAPIVRSRVTTAIIRACADDMPTLDPRELDWGVLNKYKKPAPSGLTPPRHGNGGPRVGRNDPCPCGSGKKYKHCCGKV
jgi:hypothetical protein